MSQAVLLPERPSTPSHHPTAGVSITRDEVEFIARNSFPTGKLVDIQELGFGKSFNNRIYFVRISVPTTNEEGNKAANSHSNEEEFVLKVNGRFFGAEKIQNEVGCLRLLGRYCASIPVPKVISWSEDGSVGTFQHDNAITEDLVPRFGEGEKTHGGWILMSRVPGSPISDHEDLKEATMVSLGTQLGKIAANWRKNVPSQSECGNVSFTDAAVDAEKAASDFPFHIRGILHETMPTFDTKITTPNAYYAVRLEDKIKKLETTEAFAPNLSLVAPLRAFIASVLPHLNLDVRGKESSDLHQPFVFTHYDLSPRNVLISRGGDLEFYISGVLDFEFSGFFPLTDEFLNDSIANEGDWTAEFYTAYLDSLIAEGVTNPSHGFDDAVWKTNFALETLHGDVAPWYLPGPHVGEALSSRLTNCRESVESLLVKLSGESTNHQSQ